MIEEVKMFKTDDGSVFGTKEKAEYHEAVCSFCDWYYDGHKLYGNTESVDFEDVAKWLKENKEKVLDFLQKIS